MIFENIYYPNKKEMFKVSLYYYKAKRNKLLDGVVIFLFFTLGVGEIFLKQYLWSILFLFIAIQTFIFPWISAKDYVDKYYDDPISKNFRMEINDEGFLITSDDFKQTFTWDYLSEWYETPYSFGIFISKESSFSVYKKGFVDENQIDEFRELVSSKLPMQKS